MRRARWRNLVDADGARHAMAVLYVVRKKCRKNIYTLHNWHQIAGLAACCLLHSEI
jgi:hypothetical protein